MIAKIRVDYQDGDFHVAGVYQKRSKGESLRIKDTKQDMAALAYILSNSLNTIQMDLLITHMKDILNAVSSRSITIEELAKLADELKEKAGDSLIIK